MKHTQGPWDISYDNADDRGGGQWFNVGPAEVWFSYGSTEEERQTACADAHLISVAPELLALVKRYRAETPLGHQPHMIAHEADAAIAKAEGGDDYDY